LAGKYGEAQRSSATFGRGFSFVKMKMADGKILRRNRPGTSQKV